MIYLLLQHCHYLSVLYKFIKKKKKKKLYFCYTVLSQVLDILFGIIISKLMQISLT